MKSRTVAISTVIVICAGGFLCRTEMSAYAQCQEDCWCGAAITAGPDTDDCVAFNPVICRPSGTVWCDAECEDMPYDEGDFMSDDFEFVNGGCADGCPNVNDGFPQEIAGLGGDIIKVGVVPRGECNVYEE